MTPVSKDSLELAAQELAAASNSRIRALDVFFFYRENREEVESRAVSCSFGEDVYLRDDGYLNEFVKRYGTLARSDHPRRNWGAIKSKLPPPRQQQSLAMRVREFGWTDDFKAAKVADIATFLGNQNFGRYYFLTTVPQYVHELQIYVSTFVVFADELSPAKIRDTWNVLLWHLATTLGNPIIEELSKQKSLYHQKWQLSTIRNQRVRHVMKNIPFKMTMSLMGDAVKAGDWSKIERLLQVLEMQELLRDYAADVLYKSDLAPEKLLLVDHKITSYTAIISLLSETCEAPNSLTITGSNEAQRLPVNAITLYDLVPTLIILLNLWQNAWKAHRTSTKSGKIAVSFISSHGNLILTIENDGLIPRVALAAFNAKNESAIIGGQGLKDIVEAERSLKGVRVLGAIKGARTQMQLTIATRTL